MLWSTLDDLERLYGDPLAVWEPWAEDLRGHGIESGHHVAEEAPEALSHALVSFLAQRAAMTEAELHDRFEAGKGPH